MRGKGTKKVLITGVNGFLGRALWGYFKARSGVRVYGLSREVPFDSGSIFRCDLTHKRKLKSILALIKPDFIFHMAGGRTADFTALYKKNFLTTKCLLDAIREIPSIHPRIIIPGSAAEYGRMPRGKRKVRESATPHPLTAYGIVKLKQTNLGLAYARQGWDVVIARIFNVTGEGTPPSLVAGRFAQQTVMIEQDLQKGIIKTRGLDNRRDFLDVGDVCAGLWAVARCGKAGEIYNICSGRSFPVRKILRRFLSLSKLENVLAQEKTGGSPTYDAIGSNVKLRSVSGWSPRVSLERSLNKTLQGYRKNSNFRESR